jgi:hypothetical protein
VRRLIKKYICTLVVYIPVLVASEFLVHNATSYLVGLLGGVLISVALLLDITRDKESQDT